jgi:hypothetical protein
MAVMLSKTGSRPVLGPENIDGFLSKCQHFASEPTIEMTSRKASRIYTDKNTDIGETGDSFKE